jgi:hypothetical protein
MPIRFTAPSLGGHRQVFLRAGEWEVGAAYRRLTADDWFVLDQIRPDLQPNGGVNRFNINTIDLSAAYGISDRVHLRLTVPLSTGTNSRIHGDLVRHETSATGLGDVNLVGTYWLLDPVTHAGGNAAVGLGVKAPTGSNEVLGDFGLGSGEVIQHPVHPGLQVGDGGWGILLHTQAYQRLYRRLSGYVFGAYQLSPREKSDILFSPTAPGSALSVHDVYHGRAGLGYAALPSQGISLSLGVRVDGVPVRDFIGGDLGFRTPGYITYLDPGLAVARGPGVFTLSIPVRLHGEFKPSVNDENGVPGPPGDRGDLASYLIFLGYAYRF